MGSIKESFRSNPTYAVSLMVCGMAFFLKGIDYLILGSTVPFIIGLVFLSGVLYALSFQNKLGRRIVKTFAIILICWGVARLGVELLFSLTSVTEAHVRSHFNWLERFLSLSAICGGFYFMHNQKHGPSKSE